MSGYIGTQPVPQATQTRDSFTATAGQTSFATGGYTPQFLDVYLNGVHLQNSVDYTAANGSDVVLTTGAALDDVLEVVAYSTFDSANTYNRAEADAEFVNDPDDVITVSSGNVQIGNNSSVTGGRYLDVYNTASGATDFSILRFITQQAGSSSTTSADIYKRKNGQFTISNGETNPSAFTSFNVGASERVRIDSSGRVGINTTSPDFALHVQDAGSNTAATVKLGDVYHGYVQQNANDLNIISNGDQAYRASVGTNNGTGNIVFQTAHATTGNTEHMRINSAGVITTPNQPLCSMNNGAGWLTMVANTVYGVGASYAANRGGFYAGASLGGYPVTHVPATGLYRVTLHAYVTANQSGRLSLRANQSTLLCFLQIPSIPSHTALTENIVYLNAYDYLDYVTDATMQLYHADLHTYVTLEFLG